MKAVATSGSSSMSDSWIAWKPRIDEPSNARPSVKTLVVERLDRHVEVLHHAGQVTEADVDELHALVLEVSQQLLGIGEHTSSWHVHSWVAGHWRRYDHGVARPCLLCFCRVTSLAERHLRRSVPLGTSSDDTRWGG